MFGSLERARYSLCVDPGKQKTILYDTAKVIIAVEQQKLSKYGNWVSQLKTLYPSLNFEIITLESLIKP